MVDTNGLSVRLALTAGEVHDNRLTGKLLSRLKSKTLLLADRGYAFCDGSSLHFLSGACLAQLSEFSGVFQPDLE